MKSTLRAGFTLVEMLVVIAVIGVLLALLMPAIQAARESARRTACASNLRQIGLALSSYSSAHGAFPIGCVDRRPAANGPQRQLSWCVYVLPELEQAQTFEAFDLKSAFDSAKNKPAASRVLSVFLCPSTTRRDVTRSGDRTTDGLGGADYGGMYGTIVPGLPQDNGVMRYDIATRLLDLKDGPGQTIVVAEDTGRGIPQGGQWANGENIFNAILQINMLQDNEIWSDHPGTAQVLLCDAAVRSLAQQTPLTVIRALCTRAARDSVPGDLFQ